MKSILLPFLLLTFFSNAQLQDYNKERLQLDKGLMVGLGSWATANLATGAIGWATTPKGHAHYFHQMNFFWNTVNLGLAIPDYFKARKGATNLSFAETIKEQHKTEKIFLFNTGLDIAYMTSGLLLRSEAKSNLEKRDQFEGFGTSILMQGGFLFILDITAYVLHKRHASQKLNGFLENVEMSQTGIGLRWNIPSLAVQRSQLANR
jgi:hypothetical protein